jgi:hypothetical protein
MIAANRFGVRVRVAVAAALGACMLVVVPAARAEGPHWQLQSRAVPTYLAPGMSTAEIRVVAFNLGDANAKPPITISDVLPQGLVAKQVVVRELSQNVPSNEGSECSITTVTCVWNKVLESGQSVPRTEIPAYGGVEMLVTVSVEAGEHAPKPSANGTVENLIKVQGGGAQSEASEPIKIVSSPEVKVPFGEERYEVKPETETGAAATQAGEHPFQLTTILDFNETLGRPEAPDLVHPSVAHQIRNLHFVLPPGLVANAKATRQCTTAQFNVLFEAGEGNLTECPGESAIGVATLEFWTKPLGLHTEEVPVFNLVPQAGEPARFGIEDAKVHVFLDTAVRTGEGYGGEVSVTNASTAVEVLGSVVTIWGDPGESHHNNARGWECVNLERNEGAEHEEDVDPCPKKETAEQNNPLLTLPTNCGVPQNSSVSGEAWPTVVNGIAQEGPEFKFERETPLPPLTSCERLDFEPTEFGVQPDKTSANTPTGLDVTEKFPQTGLLAKEGHAEADVKETTVALPEGVQANAGAANGLEDCSVAQVEFHGNSGDPSGLSGELEQQGFASTLTNCPNASKVGKVTIKTPLLPNDLEGFVYLGEQDTNPFKSPLVLYLVAQDPVSGVLVKLAGEVKINEATGQLVSTFKNTPPLPFEELKLEFFDGPRASQTTPAHCGTYKTEASLVSWSDGKTVKPTSAFTVNPGSCTSGALPFSPSFEAGSTTDEAYAFTPFTLTIGRPDGQQALKSITMHLPPGQAAMISSVAECPEPAAGQEWACGPESEIGHSTAVSGLGEDPVTLGGTVYFAGPYKGAPFSVVDITPANAGPFRLGNVVVRSTITVDPNTAAATITSDALPQFVKGVPSQLKELNVTINRPGFEFNPTNCSPMGITGTLAGYEGGGEEVSSPFQVANCAALPFAPDFTASTTSHTSKTDGANLFVKITYPKGAYANVAKSITELPYALPSRLTTIQKACPDTVFEANPAACDEGSMIGHAVVHTPVFKNPLVGPAYLVSHGNRAFPDIEIVLQGEGIMLVLDGHTDIKNSITKTSFESVPDAPVEVFELILPEGPHSALAANDNLCKPEKPGTVTEKVTEHVKGRAVQVTKKVHKLVPEELVIPTKLVAQNGRVLEQKTKIAVSGCGGVKGIKTTKKAKKAKKAGRSHEKK